MDGLSAAGSILAVLQVTITVIGYLKDVKNAPEDCQHFQAEASNLFNLLNNLYFHLNQKAGNAALLTSVRALSVENGPLDQYKLALQQLQQRLESQSRGPNIKSRLLWKFTKEEVSSLLARMERVKSHITIALATDQIEVSKSILNDTTVVRNALTSALPIIEANTTTTRDAQRDQQCKAILQWLSPTDFPAQLNDVVSRRAEGTAQWFLDSPEFKRWVIGEDRTLLCQGIPGAGKTMLAAIGISHLYETARISNDVGIAYVFCSYKAKFEQSAPSLIAALLKQIIQGRPDLMAPVEAIYDKRRGEKPPPGEIYSALQSACVACKMVYLIIDALDEYNDRDGIHFDFIDKLLRLQTVARVQILFTSRSIPSITDSLATCSALEVRASEEDVSRFVLGQLSRLPACVRKDQALQDTIVTRITTAADGMFLLAQLHVKSLYDKRNRSSVLRTLDKLLQNTETLDQAYLQAYDETILRIEDQSPSDQDLAKRALYWISYAQRLLTVDELSCALAVEPGDTALNHDNLFDIEDVVSVCAGLVTIDETTQLVRLVHYTTQGYIEQKRLEWNPNAELTVATTCLTYLQFDQFRSDSRDTDEAFDLRFADSKLFDYAARFWAEHIGPEDEIPLAALAVSFLRETSLVENVVQVTHPLRDLWLHDIEVSTLNRHGLFLTAEHGLLHLTSQILDTCELPIDQQDSLGYTPFMLAARYGHEEVVGLLISTGRVNVNAKSIWYETALLLAAESGHASVVERLLRIKELDVGFTNDDTGETALWLAASGGHEGMVRQLLETGKVDVNACEWEHQWTPLMAAAQGGHIAVVRLLLGIDNVDVELKDESSLTALALAAGAGHAAVVIELLELGKAQVNSRDQRGGRTPLAWAAARGHETVVKVLLAAPNIEVEPTDQRGWTPLSYAIERGHTTVAKLLREAAHIEAD